MITLNGSFSQQYDPIDFIEAGLHHIWHMVIGTAKITEPQDTAHDSLTILLLYFRQLGTLRRKINGIEERAVIGNGLRVWTDLPYFGTDLMAEWQRLAGMTAKQRISLAAFTGKCVALGVGSVDITCCTLWLPKEALEGSQELASEKDGGIPIVELLPACTRLFQQCGHKLLTLCINDKTLEQEDLDPSSFGQAATNKLANDNPSVERWFSWRKKFQELSQSQDEVVARESKRGFDAMIGCGREMGYVVEGEEKYWDKVLSLLSDELKRSGKESVGLEDIVTNPQWVDYGLRFGSRRNEML
jgi:hypothetical protein